MAKFYIPKVCAIVLTYNDEIIVKKCIDSLLISSYSNLEIILVDNHSESNIASSLQSIYPTINCVRLDKNFGYAGGLNQAIKFLINKKPEIDYFLLLNNDVSLEPNVISNLINIGENYSDIGFIGPESIKRDGSGLHDYWVPQRKSKFNPIDLILEDDLDYSRKEIVQVEFVSGHCLMVKTEVLREIGLMRPDFFIYWEEVEWQWRGYNFGWKAFVCPGTIVYHDRLSFSKPFNSYLRNRNLLFFNRIILKNNLFFFPFFVKNIFVQIFELIKILFSIKKLNHVWPIIKGFLHGSFNNIPEIEYLETQSKYVEK